MDDWSAPAPEPHEILGPRACCCARTPPTRPPSRRWRRVLDDAERPRSSPAPAPTATRLGRAHRARRAPRLPGLPGAVRRPGRLPAGPSAVRRAPARRAARGCATTLAPHDAVLVVGTGAIRQYPYDPGPLVEPGTRLALVTQDPEEAHRSPVELAVLGDAGGASAPRSPRPSPRATPRRRPRRAAPPPPAPPAAGEPLRAGHVLQALAERLPRDAILLEETPWSRPELHARVPRDRAARLRQRDGHARLRAARRDRPADGAARPARAGGRRRRLGALPDPGAVERGRVRAPACCSSSCATAATRSWTGSPSAPAPTARGPRWTRRHRRDGARAGLRGARDRDHAELLGALDAELGLPADARRCCSRSSSRRTRRSIAVGHAR